MHFFHLLQQNQKQNKRTQMNSVYEILVYFFSLNFFEWAMCAKTTFAMLLHIRTNIHSFVVVTCCSPETLILSFVEAYFTFKTIWYVHGKLNSLQLMSKWLTYIFYHIFYHGFHIWIIWETLIESIMLWISHTKTNN
jgi:hypothetical protein